MKKQSWVKFASLPDAPAKVPISRKSFTAPGMSISPKVAFEAYKSGTLQRNMQVFYNAEEQIDLQTCSLLERLELQAKYREDLEKARMAYAADMKAKSEKDAQINLAKLKQQMRAEFEQEYKKSSNNQNVNQ